MPYLLLQDSSPLTRQSQTKSKHTRAARLSDCVVNKCTSLKRDLLSSASVACTPLGLRTSSLCERSVTNYQRFFEMLRQLALVGT